MITKCASPEHFGLLRNLSCTPLFSKALEFFVLEKLKTEVKPSDRQYGGLKGCGTNQYLVDAWNFILESLEDPGTIAANLLSIDFAKAFNNMDHLACLRQRAFWFFSL